MLIKNILALENTFSSLITTTFLSVKKFINGSAILEFPPGFPLISII